MEFLLLGPVEIRSGGRLLDMGARQQRSVVAALAVDVGRPVAVPTLIDRIWDDAAPPGARAALYSHIARIRQALNAANNSDRHPARLVRSSAGYLLDVDPDQVDLHRFRRLTAAARDAGRPEPERIELLDAALGLWRGVPLADVTSDWAERTRAGWRQQHLDAAVARAQAEMAHGQPDLVIGPIRELLAAHPMAEPLVGVLMRALAATNRQNEALGCYADLREQLTDELGAEPGPELQAVHLAILRGELVAPAVAAVEPVPAQLPPDLLGFTGRDNEVRRLDQLLTQLGTGTAVVISAVSGTAGVGKTALAVHWAHRIRDHFPDGQLYVNLRGYDPNRAPMPPSQAIREFLDGFGVPPQRIPASVDGQAALYRSLLADRRVLVVLDNARTAEQVRPLLPGSPGCLALVTSRNQLPGLVAADGAQPVSLDLMSGAEARDLLTRRLGAERIAAESPAVDEIIDRCARLPLALAIVSARAATHPGFPLAVLAKELYESRAGLDAFESEDASTDIRAVFSWSYRALGAGAAKVFRLLGLHPGPDFAVPAVASLAELPVQAAREAVAILARAHLVTELHPGRFTFHDLLRAYARELAHRHDTEVDRRAAVHRLLDHYLHTSRSAAMLLNPHQDPISVPPPRAGTVTVAVTDRRQALAWFATEHPALVAAIDDVTGGFDRHAAELAWSLEFFFDSHERWQDWAGTQATALAAARRLADQPAEALAARSLARAFIRLDRDADAAELLMRSLTLAEELGDEAGQGHTHRDIAWRLERRGCHAEALRHARQALERYRSIGHHTGEARALNAIGWLSAKLGYFTTALDHCEQAVAVQERIGDEFGQAETLDSLGYVLCHLGRLADGASCYRRAVEFYRKLDSRYNEADTLAALGDTYHSAGDLDAARSAWLQALSILDEMAHPEAEQVRAKLAAPAAG